MLTKTLLKKYKTKVLDQNSTIVPKVKSTKHFTGITSLRAGKYLEV